MTFREELIRSIRDNPNPSYVLQELLRALENMQHSPPRIHPTYNEARARVMSYMSTGTEDNWRNFLEDDHA